MSPRRIPSVDAGDADAAPVALPRRELRAREEALKKSLSRARALQRRSPGPEVDAELASLTLRQRRYKLHLERQRNVMLLGDPGLLEQLPAYVNPVLRAIRAPFFYSVWLRAERTPEGVSFVLNVTGSKQVVWAKDEPDALDLEHMPMHFASQEIVASNLDDAVAEALAGINADFAQ